VEEFGLELRRRTQGFFVEHGRGPAAHELGDPDSVLEQLGLTDASWALTGA
jgi:hypothetical protein